VGSLLRRTRAVVLVTQWGFAPVDFPAIFAALPVEDRAALGCVLAPQRPLKIPTLAGLPVLPLDGNAADAGPDEATASAPCLTFTTSNHQRTQTGPARPTNNSWACRGRSSLHRP
jgi:fatty-acyl-CoA synthase